jgi:hypothetical protein
VQFFFSSGGARSSICVPLQPPAVFATEADMTMTHREDIQRRIIELEVEHRDLDAVIDLLSREVRHEELQLRRLKKRKLQLKDHIMLLKMQLIPDIPA